MTVKDIGQATIGYAKGKNAASWEHLHRQDLDVDEVRRNIGNVDVDLKRTPYNVDLLERLWEDEHPDEPYQYESIQMYYERKFGTWDSENKTGTGALAEYNKKCIETRHKSNVIPNYYQHCIKSGNLNAAHEVVAQIGNKDTNSAKVPENRILSTEIYKTFLKDWMKKHPYLHVVDAVVHNDEATPHLHIKYVPWVDQSKAVGKFKVPKRQTSLQIKNSLKCALKACGYQKSQDEAIWCKDDLQNILKRDYGIERLELGLKNHTMSVTEFKLFCENEKSQYNNDPALFQLLYEYQDLTDELKQALVDNNNEWNAALDQFEQKIDEFPKRKINTDSVKQMLEESIPKRNLLDNFNIAGIAQTMLDLKDKVAEIPSSWRQNIMLPVKKINSIIHAWHDKYRQGIITEKDWEKKFPRPKQDNADIDTKTYLEQSTKEAHQQQVELSKQRSAERKARREARKN